MIASDMSRSRVFGAPMLECFRSLDDFAEILFWKLVFVLEAVEDAGKLNIDIFVLKVKLFLADASQYSPTAHEHIFNHVSLDFPV
jgi:hypothetical protein